MCLSATDFRSSPSTRLARCDSTRYLDIDRTEQFVLIRVNLSTGRSTDAKQAFYARLAELLHERVGIRTEDVAIVLAENTREDWSFGRGEASYVVLPREAWR